MKEQNKSSLGKSFKEVIRSLLNVGGDMLRKAPMIVVVFFITVMGLIYSFSQEENTSKLIISILIGIFSIGIYLKNDSFSETILTLFLGLLTVFSIQWTHANTVIFSFILGSFIVIYFLISALKITAKIETILTPAATFISVRDHSSYLKRLNRIATTQTKFRQMTIVERAEATKLLVYSKFPIDQMVYLISIIEMIKVVYQVSFADAWDYFYTLNQIQNKVEDRNVILPDIEYIHDKFCQLAITPKEFIDIVKETKLTLISQKYDWDTYLNKLSGLIDDGYSKNNIITHINDEL